MSASQSLRGPSRCGRVLGPSLDKIIKNAEWPKHSHLVAACKSTLDKLESVSESESESPTSGTNQSQSPLSGLPSTDAEYVLQPLILALDSAFPKVVDLALECTFKLFFLALLHGEIDSSTASQSGMVFNIIDAICKFGNLGEEAIELGVLRVLLSAVRSPCTLIWAGCLIQIVRTCYNVYLEGVNNTNQICAKSVLAQIMTIVFARFEEDCMDIPLKKVSVNDLLEFTDKNLNEGNSIQFCQNFITEDITFRHETVKCLVSITKSMGAMDQQTKIGDLYRPKISDCNGTLEHHLPPNGEEANAFDHELHPDVNSEFSDAAVLEQCRAYKIELQVGS
ncbi:hypothetical protein HN51_018164 [Arachis hypogaea]